MGNPRLIQVTTADFSGQGAGEKRIRKKKKFVAEKVEKLLCYYYNWTLSRRS